MRHLPKKGLMSYFGIKDGQMSADLRAVQDAANAAGGEIEIQAGRLVGRMPSDPVFDIPPMDDVIRSGAFGHFVSIDVQARINSDDRMMGRIMSSIVDRMVIEFDYISMTSGRSRKKVSVHHVVEAAGRMHFRGFNHAKNAYRDFVVNRIERITREVPELRYVDARLDTEFHEKVRLVLSVNPDLSPEQRTITCRDFGLDSDGRREIMTTKAHVIYLRAQFGERMPDYVPPVLLSGQ